MLTKLPKIRITPKENYVFRSYVLGVGVGMKKKIQEIIEQALFGAIIDKYTHRILNEGDIAKEATEDIMDYLKEKRDLGTKSCLEKSLV